MKFIRQNDNHLLLKCLEELRRKNPLWFSLFIRLSQLSIPVAPPVVEAIGNRAAGAAGADNVELHLPGVRDAVLIVQHTPTTIATKLASDICFLFIDDPLAAERMGERGNGLCTIFSTREEFDELHALVREIKCSPDPLVLEDAPYRPDMQSFALARRQRGGRGRPCVLIVEDQRFSRHMVAQILGRNYDIFMAENGHEAMRLYETRAPDIVFLDIDLPGLSGLNVLEHIGQLDNEAFVVMLTASNAAEDVQQALARRAKGYIVKPFTRQKIAQYLTLFNQQFPQRAKAS